MPNFLRSKCGKIGLTMKALISCQDCRLVRSSVCPRNANYSKDVSCDFFPFVQVCMEGSAIEIPNGAQCCVFFLFKALCIDKCQLSGSMRFLFHLSFV